MKEKDWSYIRRDDPVREELFHLSEDANEQRNLAGDPRTQSTLEQMRAMLSRLTGGPLLPEASVIDDAVRRHRAIGGRFTVRRTRHARSA